MICDFQNLPFQEILAILFISKEEYARVKKENIMWPFLEKLIHSYIYTLFSVFVGSEKNYYFCIAIKKYYCLLFIILQLNECGALYFLILVQL